MEKDRMQEKRRGKQKVTNCSRRTGERAEGGLADKVPAAQLGRQTGWMITQSMGTRAGQTTHFFLFCDLAIAHLMAHQGWILSGNRQFAHRDEWRSRESTVASLSSCAWRATDLYT
jgi:hypothetical protein